MNKKEKRGLKQGLISSLIITIILIGGSIYVKNNFVPKEETLISSETVESSLKEAKELTTLKYHYKNIASFENSQEFQGFKLPFTTKRFLYTYAGVIHAGVDLDKAKVDVNNEDKTVSVTLPKSKILSHDIDEKSVMFYDEKNSIFNPLELEDYSNFRKEEEAKVEKEAVDKGLLTEADEQSKKAVEDILKINPEIAEHYTINVK
ncbi:DUF4230 domain-containing protein [Anaerococcus sp. Marseille-Q7828]|uniref:DUF4230 domain-containing protein n=1 Tax=Anaerococcus sp. Marseille-Q7828 TaxID=3036300 RepID=UPI0024AD8411|nr:DUF4230 domain-containing protein [Anaerococcus sp. Marseille-Q7828]